MRSFAMSILLLAFVAQARAKELVAKYDCDNQGKTVVTGTTSKVVDKLVGKLFDRFLIQDRKKLPFHHKSLSDTTLGKPGMPLGTPGNMAVPSRMGLKALPTLHFMPGGMMRSRCARDVVVKADFDVEYSYDRPSYGENNYWSLGPSQTDVEWDEELFGADLAARFAKEYGQGQDAEDGKLDWFATLGEVKEMQAIQEEVEKSGLRNWECNEENLAPVTKEYWDRFAGQKVLQGWRARPLKYGFKLVKSFPVRHAKYGVEMEKRVASVSRFLGHPYRTLETNPDEQISEERRGPVVRVVLHTSRGEIEKTVSKMDMKLATLLNEINYDDIKARREAYDLQSGGSAYVPGQSYTDATNPMEAFASQGDWRLGEEVIAPRDGAAR